MASVAHSASADKSLRSSRDLNRERVAIYCCVSTDEQRERQSIETQRDFCQTYCTLHGLPVADVYLDDGVSGSLDFRDRPEGARLLRDAEAGLFTMVLVYKLGRLARDPRHTLNEGNTDRSVRETVDGHMIAADRRHDGRGTDGVFHFRDDGRPVGKMCGIGRVRGR